MKRTPIKRSNPKRKKREFVRCYHSEERVEFVKNLPCIVTLKAPSENAHIENGGMGRKADYDKIVPLSHDKHRELHQIGRETFERKYPWIDLEKSAADTEAAWQAYPHTLEKSA